MPMLGGPIVTAGGVVFIGATADNYIRAFDVNNGKPAVAGPLARGRSGNAYELFDKRSSVRRDRGGRPWVVRHKARRLCDRLRVAAAVSGPRRQIWSSAAVTATGEPWPFPESGNGCHAIRGGSIREPK